MRAKLVQVTRELFSGIIKGSICSHVCSSSHLLGHGSAVVFWVSSGSSLLPVDSFVVLVDYVEVLNNDPSAVVNARIYW
jgi:hypothetical protein